MLESTFEVDSNSLEMESTLKVEPISDHNQDVEENKEGKSE
jgi:hypothetical protein